MTHATPAPHVTIFGAGSFGTALAISLANHEQPVTLYARREEHVEQMRTTRRNPRYLKTASMPTSIRLTSDLEVAARAATMWVFCTPAQTVRQVAGEVAHLATSEHIVYSAAKGIETGTHLRPSEVLEAALPNVPKARLGVLFGPSHAEEVAQGQPTALVASGYDMECVRRVQATFMAPTLRVYSNSDVVGVEVGGCVKNILAIAAGMSDGMGGGDNAKAALVTRGIAEIRRLGMALGARPMTFGGLTGIGDLVVTCMSSHSRNRYVGEQIGRGRSLQDILDEMQMVAEGVPTTESVHEWAHELGVEMPLVSAVYHILFEAKHPQQALIELMTRQARHEEELSDVLGAC